MPAEPVVEWNDDELIGACKVAWNESGQIANWSEYSPDALIDDNGDAYSVTFVSSAGGRDLTCTVRGTPAAPEVDLV